MERLETVARPVPRVILQYGWLKKLPRDYPGGAPPCDFEEPTYPGGPGMD
jgi:hypothetical protein